jgi:hypothetical protein
MVVAAAAAVVVILKAAVMHVARPTAKASFTHRCEHHNVVGGIKQPPGTKLVVNYSY